MKFSTPGPEATRELGIFMGQQIDCGLAIGLIGDLGAGKTALIQGLARGLAVPPAVPITSPSYTLINEYPGRFPLFHVDLYRLSGGADLEELGLEEILDGAGVAAIEWAQRLDDPERETDLIIAIAIQSETRRAFSLSARTEAGGKLIQAMEEFVKEKRWL